MCAALCMHRDECSVVVFVVNLLVAFLPGPRSSTFTRRPTYDFHRPSEIRDMVVCFFWLLLCQTSQNEDFEEKIKKKSYFSFCKNRQPPRARSVPGDWMWLLDAVDGVHDVEIDRHESCK